MTNYDALRSLGIDCKNIPGDQKVVCPKCSPTRKNSRDRSLSVNIDKGVFMCHHCSWHSSVAAMKPKKEYTKPSSELKNLSEPVIKWFADRGISNQTLLRYKITESTEYMPQVEKEVRCINFNYFYENELVNIKYRDSAKNFKLVSGAMLSLYGLDVCLDNSDTDILICEGEPDVLAFYEAGIKCAVSVPNGASKGNQKLEWLDDLYHVFEGKRIYLATDMDEPGISLRNELARRLGKQNCWIVELPEKDANDTLLKHGPEALVDAVNTATPFPVEGLEDANSKSHDLLALYDQGYPEGFGTGYDMDENFKWFPGQVTLFTGKPGDGKTTILKNKLAKFSMNHGWVNLIYSAEEANTEFALADMLSIILNKPFFNVPGHQRITREEVEYWTPWLAEHFKYYKLGDETITIEGILAKAEEMVKRFGINTLVIDNMSTVERSLSKNSDNRHHSIGEMLGDIVKFARNYGVHVFIVAHPKKMAKINGTHEIPTGYDVGDCYSQDTEVLTEKGWMFHNEWNGERIAMFNMNSGEIEFDYPEKLNSFDYTGVMHHYNSKMIDVLVSPNHKMVVKPNWYRFNRDKYINGWQLIESKDMSGSGFKMPSCAKYSSQVTSSFVEGYNDVDLAELCGYYTSEGTYSSNSFSLSQRPGDVLDKMISCFNRLGIEINVNVREDKRGYLDSVYIRAYKKGSEAVINWILDNCGKYSYGVKVPDAFFTASEQVRMAFLQANIDGDGAKTKYGHSINTTSKYLCDGLQAIATSLGYRTSCSVKHFSKPNHKPIHYLNLTPNAPDFSVNTGRYRKEVMYEGKIYCFTTRTGAYVTRRNGKVSFQGNSSHYYNKVDNGMTVFRNRETGLTELHRWKVRFRYTGSEGVDYFKFNVATGVFTSAQKLNDGSDKTKFKGQPLGKDEYARLAGINAPGV